MGREIGGGTTKVVWGDGGGSGRWQFEAVPDGDSLRRQLVGDDELPVYTEGQRGRETGEVK